MGDGWIAVATDKQYIRLYSLGGVQREVISSPGQIVTMAGRDSSLAVVYQTTPCEIIISISTVYIQYNITVYTCMYVY